MPAASDHETSLTPPLAFVCNRLPSATEVAIDDQRHWQPLSSAALSLDDWGTLQGATLVERMRTVSGVPLDAQGHLDRLRASAEVLGIDMPKYLTCKVIEACVQRNRQSYRETDFAVVVLLTPGHTSDRPPGSCPTVIVHPTPLHWKQLGSWYQSGQPLVMGATRNVPAECWSPHIKTRSRLHYFLADSQAAMCGLPFAGAAMLSIEGHLTESSVANLMLVENGRLVAPFASSVLQGLSLQRTMRLAARLGIPVEYRSITLEDAKRAEALLLTGSSGCLWPASQLDGSRYSQPTQHAIYQLLRDAWIEELGLDYIQQAIEFGSGD